MGMFGWHGSILGPPPSPFACHRAPSVETPESASSPKRQRRRFRYDGTPDGVAYCDPADAGSEWYCIHDAHRSPRPSDEETSMTAMLDSRTSLYKYFGLSLNNCDSADTKCIGSYAYMSRDQ